MPAQDDAREREMRQLFNLKIAPERGRADVDAFLELDGKTINFELKSSTGKSFSTVRDFGPDHVAKWRNSLHWIFAFYNKGGDQLLRCIYASPADMEPWIAEKEAYVAPDFALADTLPDFVSEVDLIEILGDKAVYSVADAKLVMKKQWKAADYKDRQDVPHGFSKEAMVKLMRLRAAYVLRRGSTLNNPHIPGSYFKNFEAITDEHASKVRALVSDYLRASATDSATA